MIFTLFDNFGDVATLSSEPSKPKIRSRAAAYRASRSCKDSPVGGGDVAGLPWDADDEELWGRLRIRIAGWNAPAGGGITEPVRDDNSAGIGAES